MCRIKTLLGVEYLDKITNMMLNLLACGCSKSSTLLFSVLGNQRSVQLHICYCAFLVSVFDSVQSKLGS